MRASTGGAADRRHRLVRYLAAGVLAIAGITAALLWASAAAGAYRLNPVELVWSHLKRSLANLAKRNLPELTALVRTRLKRMQYRPALLGGFLASTGLDLTPFL